MVRIGTGNPGAERVPIGDEEDDGRRLTGRRQTLPALDSPSSRRQFGKVLQSGAGYRRIVLTAIDQTIEAA